MQSLHYKLYFYTYTIDINKIQLFIFHITIEKMRKRVIDLRPIKNNKLLIFFDDDIKYLMD